MIFVYHHWILLYVNDVSISVYIFCLQSNPAYISIIAQDSRLLPNSSSYIVVHTTPSHTTAKYTRRPADIEQSHTVPAMGFEVRRTSRSYVRPAAATPAGSLELSAIDRVVGLRHMVPSLHLYPPRGRGAAKVFLIDRKKISEVTDKQKYRIYRNSIGDRLFFSDKI